MDSQSKVLCNTGRLIKLSISQSRQSVEINLFAVRSSKISRIEDRIIWRDNRSERILESVVCASCVLFRKWLLKLPCFAVLSKYKDIKNNRLVREVILLTLFNGEITVVGCFPWPFSDNSCLGLPLGLENFKFKLLDGPDILLFEKNGSEIFIRGAASDKICQKFDLESPNRLNRDADGIRIKSFLHDPALARLCFMTAMEVKGSCSEVSENDLHTCLIYDYHSNLWQKLCTLEDIDYTQPDESNICLPPKSYWPFIAAFITFKSCMLHQKPSEGIGSGDQRRFTAVATKMKQFLVFDGFNSLLCCPIPFQDCNDIVLCQVGCFVMHLSTLFSSLLAWGVSSS